MKSLYGKICGLLFAGVFAVTSYPATGCSPAQTPSKTQGTADKKDDGVVRILAIGNSFSQDAIENYLHQLASSTRFWMSRGIISAFSRRAENPVNTTPIIHISSH